MPGRHRPANCRFQLLAVQHAVSRARRFRSEFCRCDGPQSDVDSDLPEDFADTRLAFADGLPVDMTSSMHHDFEAGNKLELPWLAGAVLRLGREVGIETPVCQTVYAALLPHAGGRAET